MKIMQSIVLVLLIVLVAACGVTIKRDCGAAVADKDGSKYMACTTTIHEDGVLCNGSCSAGK